VEAPQKKRAKNHLQILAPVRIPPPHAFSSHALLRERARQATNSYEAQPYQVRITLFRAAESKFYRMHPEEPCLGWDSVAAGGVEVHRVSGMHGKLVKEPHVEGLATRLKTCLEQARTSSSP
jgi:thioesterase domain-containing protein